MRTPNAAAAIAVASAALFAAGSAGATPLKVMSVDQHAMVVLDGPTVQRQGDRVTAKLLSVTNIGYQLSAYYENPQRFSVSISCGADTFSVAGRPDQPIARPGPVARTADWLCKGEAPAYAVERGNFGELGRAYLAYVAVTPGVFFVYHP